MPVNTGDAGNPGNQGNAGNASGGVPGLWVTDRYRLVESIGQGGMGRVWRATDDMLDRSVAVKEMRIDGLDTEDTRIRRERTLREARATARIDHPNVVRIYDVVDEGERLWIVMELVDGRSLEQIVVEDGPLGPRETARIGLELVAALRQVHAGGVLHRDIKPGNVLVEERGSGAGGGRVVLTDFGIAAIQDAKALTMVGMLVGSPDYMAPERISGRPQGPPSDVWSLGATLCAALGGHSPFARSTTLATLHAVLYEEPELPDVEGELRDILGALLEKEPEVRPGLGEVEGALREVRAGAVEPPQSPRSVERPVAGSATGALGRGEAPTPALLDPEVVRAARRLPNAGADAVGYGGAGAVVTEGVDEGADEVEDAVPAELAEAEPADVENAPPAPAVPPAASNAATETPSEERSERPVTAVSATAALVETAAPVGTPETVEPTKPSEQVEIPVPVQQPPLPSSRSHLPTVPAGTPLPPTELPTPARPLSRTPVSHPHRRTWPVAVAGVVVAGALTVVLVMATGGSAHRTNDGEAGSPVATTQKATPTPTVEGTSRPSTLPPGSRTESGLFAWVPPKGWKRIVNSGSEVHYRSPDGGAQEVWARASTPTGTTLLENWQKTERDDTSKGRDYHRIRLEETTFRGLPAVVWEYTVTAQGRPWHARLLGFRDGDMSYEVSTWYHTDIETQAVKVYEQLKRTFTPLKPPAS